ncbi:hypothetical protein [Streptosporangium sp. CA-115845]|uniref:hypothetical protein n=1 Tax=Streptosporangium sp. CA-115845 TaxID=3240071 RepID=UPI003D8ABE1F
MSRKKSPEKAAPVRHRPSIARTAGEFGKVYRLVCTCGRIGRDWYAPGPAQQELEQHVATLPLIPEAQQCADPKRHDRRVWEPCAVCERQEPLFDLALEGSES